MRRLISLIVLLVYINMLIGCSKSVRLHRSDLRPDDYNKIVGLTVAGSDRDIDFDDEGGRYDMKARIIKGRAADGRILSYPMDSLECVMVEITGSDSTFTKRYKTREFVSSYKKQSRESTFKKIQAITLLDGTQITFNQPGGKLSLDKKTVFGDTEYWKPVEVPVDSVLYAQVLRSDPTGTAVLFVSLGVLIILAIMTSERSEEDDGEWKVTSTGGDPRFGSCPLVYSYTGDEYILDAQPLSGAICPAMKRSEISLLEHLQPVNGEYRVMIKNVLYETEYLDDISMFYVDYPEGNRVFFDFLENPFHLGEIHSPAEARDEAGEDLSHFVRESDGISWRSRMPMDTLNPNTSDRHQLTFTFPKPPEAQTGVLVVNVGTTFWASKMVREFLQMKGSSLPEWFYALEEDPRELEKLKNLLKRDGTYLLPVEVEENGGYNIRGYLHYGGPVAIEDKAMRLDLSHIVGDTVTLRVRPPFGFWTIDYIGMAYDEYEPPEPQYLEFISAYDYQDHDIRSALEKRDGEYHQMPRIGDLLNATFACPDMEAREGMKRSLFMKMSGHYWLHFDLTVQPRTDLVGYLESTPGATIELSTKEYLKRLAAIYRSE